MIPMIDKVIVSTEFEYSQYDCSASRSEYISYY